MTTASLIRVANLDQLHGDGPHALSGNGFDVVVVRTPAGLRAFRGSLSAPGRAARRRRTRWRQASLPKRIAGALVSTLDSAKVGRNALYRVPSSKGRAPSSSTFRRFPAGRAGSRQSAHWTICRVREGCRFWATSISSIWRRFTLTSNAGPRGLDRCICSDWARSVSWCFQTQSGVNRSCGRGPKSSPVNPKLFPCFPRYGR